MLSDIFRWFDPLEVIGGYWGIHPNGNYDIKESSSAAHLYGKTVASAEAFTDVKFNASLAFIKSLADYAYAFGINEFVVCASAYQPWLDRIPGSTGGGRHYCIQRNNTYWDYSAPFWDYQSRNACILRQGRSIQQFCVYLGENAPVKILTYRLPDLPGGYDFDAFTSDALYHRMSTKDNTITLPDGTNYQMMILPRNGDMTVRSLQKIDSLVQQGAIIYGPKPTYPHSRKDIDKRHVFDRIVKRLWGNTPSGKRNVNKGCVYWGMPLSEAIHDAGIIPDIQLKDGNTKSDSIYFCHRRVSDADVYFLDNHKDRSEDNLFTFASRNRFVQLWNTVTGKRYELPIESSQNQTSSIRLHMAPRESFFIVFTNEKEDLPILSFQTKKETDSLNIPGPWQVYFDKKKGGPGWITMNQLKDWTTFDDPRIKYYSGTAIYRTELDLPSFDNHKVTLDLHNPGFVAKVYVNNQEAGIVWCSPWSLDISKYARKGHNEISIHVANSLINRMVYDEMLPLDKRITYAYPSIVNKNDPLEPSGLKTVTYSIE